MEGTVERHSAYIDRRRRRFDSWGDGKSREIARIFSTYVRISRVVSAVIVCLGNAMPDTGRANAKNERHRPAGSFIS